MPVAVTGATKCNDGSCRLELTGRVGLFRDFLHRGRRW